MLPMTVRFFTKKELFRIPLFGSAISAVGMIKIDRSNHEHSVRTMNHAVDTIRKFDVSVVIFPEGTRSPDGKIRAFKKGGFIVAIKGGVPVVPVAISGSHRILKKHTLRVQPGRVKVVFGKPIETSGMTYRERDLLIQRTRDEIIAMIDESYNGIGSDQIDGDSD
jgi:1-acyl-sn-glycerol-3-phosphate acyltransferase